jgi:hypothetical protein
MYKFSVKQAGAGVVERHFPNVYTAVHRVHNSAARTHRACAMPRAPLRRTSLIMGFPRSRLHAEVLGYAIFKRKMGAQVRARTCDVEGGQHFYFPGITLRGLST